MYIRDVFLNFLHHLTYIIHLFLHVTSPGDCWLYTAGIFLLELLFYLFFENVLSL